MTSDTATIDTIEVLQSINDTGYWVVALLVVVICLLVISLFFIAMKAGKQ